MTSHKALNFTVYCVVSKGQRKNSEPESWCSCPYCWWFRNPAINHLGCSFDSKTVCKKKVRWINRSLVNTGLCGPSTCFTSKIPSLFLRPYKISAPIIFRLLRRISEGHPWRSAVLMLQRHLAVQIGFFFVGILLLSLFLHQLKGFKERFCL